MVFIIEGADKWTQRHTARYLAKILGCDYFLCGGSQGCGSINNLESYKRTIKKIQKKMNADQNRNIVVADLFLRHMAMEKWTGEPCLIPWHLFDSNLDEDKCLILIRNKKNSKLSGKNVIGNISEEMFEIFEKIKLKRTKKFWVFKKRRRDTLIRVALYIAFFGIETGVTKTLENQEV